MLLLAPVIAIAAVLIAILIAPPIAGLAWGAKTIDARLTVLGADFTHIPRFPERSTIYAADGKTVLATLYLDNREIVDLPDISEMGRKSVLAIEDAQFYEHGPLDWTSLIRALLTNAATGEVVQGGSTITQQLVKNAVTGDTSQTFQRKFQELALAIRVEQRYTKDQILSLYLNDVYFANGVYGIGTAADFYFHIPASKLKLTQSAMLAGLIRSPNYYDPLAHPVKARIRRNVVLDRLAELGWVPQERIDRAKASPLGLAPDIGRIGLRQPPFLVRYLTRAHRRERRTASSTRSARRRTPAAGASTRAGCASPPRSIPIGRPPLSRWRTSPTGNPSRTRTTSRRRTPRSSPSTTRRARSAPCSPVGTTCKDQVNLADARRQSGSSFKPFTLVAAFREGIPPGAVYSTKSPLFLPEWSGNDCSCVSNAEGAGDAGYQSLWGATQNSINVVFAQLILEVGPEKVVEAAHDMGIESELPAVPSLTLGTADVTPIEMASAYQTLANDGKHCESYAVAKVVDADGVLYRHKPSCKQVIAPEIAHLVTAMMQGVVSGGTGSAAALGTWPVAGKTGTTQDYTNAWFVGFTRQVSTAVWVGFPGTPDPLSNYFGRVGVRRHAGRADLARLHVARDGRDAGRELPRTTRAGVRLRARRGRPQVRERAEQARRGELHPARGDGRLGGTEGDRARAVAGWRRVGRARLAGHDPGQQRRSGQGEDPRRHGDVTRRRQGSARGRRIRRGGRGEARERSRQRRCRAGSGPRSRNQSAARDHGHDHRRDGRGAHAQPESEPSPEPSPSPNP